MAHGNRLGRLSRRHVIAGGILLVGWSAALAVYVAAAPAPQDDEISDEIYDMQHSKKYLRQIESIGGKAAVFTSELNEWLSQLWHGRPLAYTMAFLTAVVALAYYVLQGSGGDRGRPP
jgi:hypothetical protein